MRFVPSPEFMIWIALREIGPDERYSPPRALVYRREGADQRFWPTPPGPRAVRRFAQHLLDGLGEWHECGLWRRGGYWPEGGPMGELLAPFRSRGAGSIDGGAILGHSERLLLSRLMIRQILFGGCVVEDLFVIPDHGKCLLYFDHHRVVHVDCADQSAMRAFVDHMASGGYALPDELPDWTFKRPAWMQDRTG